MRVSGLHRQVGQQRARLACCQGQGRLVVQAELDAPQEINRQSAQRDAPSVLYLWHREAVALNSL